MSTKRAPLERLGWRVLVGASLFVGSTMLASPTHGQDEARVIQGSVSVNGLAGWPGLSIAFTTVEDGDPALEDVRRVGGDEVPEP